MSSKVKKRNKGLNQMNVELNIKENDLKSGKAIESYGNKVKDEKKEMINKLFKEKKELEKQKRKEFYEKQKLLNFVNHFPFSTPFGSKKYHIFQQSFETGLHSK
jgi:hypothetical protein